jgi:hypothetical protein
VASYNTGTTGSASSIPAATAFTFTVPAGVLTGDVMVVSLNVFSFTANTFGISTPSSGGGSWTQIGTTQVGSQGSVGGWGSAWYRIATASDPSSTFTVSWTGTNGGGNTFWWAADLESYTGFYTPAPIGNFSASVSSGTSAVSPSVTTSLPGSWGIQTCPSSISGSGSITGEPATNRHVLNPGAGVNNGISDTNGSAGAAGSTIGGGTWSFSASSSGAGITFTIELATTGASGPPSQPQPGSHAWRARFRRGQVPWPSPATAPPLPAQPPALLKGPPAAVKGKLAGLTAPAAVPGSGPPPQPQPGSRAWRARFRRGQVPFAPPGPPPASVPSPFTLPQIARGPAARSLARLTATRGRPGTPALFTPPRGPVRGPPAAVKGKLAGLTAPPPVAPPARTPVQAPAGLFRGRAAARPGKLSGLAALVPARVIPPAGPPRAVPPLLKGPPAATRGQLGFWRVRVFAQLFTTSGSWAAPSGLTGLPAVYAWGPAGSSVAGVFPVSNGAAGGGGAFGGEPALGGVGPGTVLTVTVGTAGSGTATTVTGGTVTVTGAAGGNGIGTSGGGGGSPGSNTLAEGGGSGGGATGGTDGGGGGGSGGSAGAGGAGQAGVIGGLGGSAGTGAAGPPSLAGAAGGNGATPSAVAQNGAVPGAAGGGGCSASGFTAAGTSQDGLALIVWAAYDLPAVTAAPGRALPGAVTGSQVVTVSAAPGPAAPFTAPRTLLRGPLARSLARLTATRGRPGIPALFAVPAVLLRGRAAARAGKLTGVAAPPPVLHPAVTSVFRLPGFPLRGPAAARKGTVAGIVAPPPVLHPAVASTFKVPGLPLRGPAAARKGSVAGVVAPPPVTQPNIPAPFYPPHLPLRGPVPVTPRTKTTGAVAPPPAPPPVAPPHWQGSTHMIAATATGNLIQGANHTGRGGPGTDLKGDYERSGD